MTIRMSCAQTEIRKPKLVINPLALVMRSGHFIDDKLVDSRKNYPRNNVRRKELEDRLIRDESHEIAISSEDDGECDDSKAMVTMEKVEMLVLKIRERKLKRKAKVLNLLYQSVIKESITYSLGLIKDFVLDCDSENIVFADKFPYAMVKFLGLLFDVKQASVETMLDEVNLKLYNELNELIQNKPFRVFWRLQSELRRIIFLKNYIASDEYETFSFIKMDPSDAAWSLPEFELNMAPEQSFGLQDLDKGTDSPYVTVDLTVDSQFTADSEKVIDVEVQNRETRYFNSAIEDSTELPPAKKTKCMKKKQARLSKKAGKAKSLMEERTSVLQDGLDTSVQCSIAERMMRNMGWDGGALGVNGTGITEPIKPDINRKASYGLGHEQATTNTKYHERPIKQKTRKENNKRDKRSQKRMEKRLEDLKLREEMKRHQGEIISMERKIELEISDETKKASYGLGHKQSKTNTKCDEGTTKRKPRKENNRREKRSQKRMEKRLEDLKLRRELKRYQGEVEKEAELEIWEETKEKKTKKAKGMKFHLEVSDRLLEFVCDPNEREISFDRSYSEKRRAQIHRLVDHVNEGGRKRVPPEWDERLVDEICKCNNSYLVSESFGKGNCRQLSIYKLPLQSVLFVNEDALLFRKDKSRHWNHLEVVVGNLLEIITEFLQQRVEEEVRFTGEWSTKSRKIVNNFLGQMKEACVVDVSVPPETEVERLVHDLHRRRPNVTLQITGEILKHYDFNSMCAKIIKVSRVDQQIDGIIVID